MKDSTIRRLAVASLTVAVSLTAPAIARAVVIQQPAEPSTTSPASTAPVADIDQSPQSLKIVVAEVKGTVRVRANKDAAWEPAVVDMVVGEDAEFRTGPRSSV